jgi:hypothetical protein
MLGAVLAAALQLAGCGIDHIRGLREAEETFSRAAEQENRGRFSAAEAMKVPSRERQVAGAALAGSVSDTTGYRLAAQMAGKLIEQKRAELEQDRLLCTAYVIKAFSLWRLGDYRLAVDASNEPCGESGPRDRALLKVVSALVRIDESNERAFNDARTQAEHETSIAELGQALADLQAADRSLNRDHPLRAYLFAARLAALRVKQVSGNREGLKDKDAGDRTESGPRLEAVAEADKTLVEYRAYLRCQLALDGDPEHPSVAYWRRLFGNAPLSAKPPICAS